MIKPDLKAIGYMIVGAALSTLLSPFLAIIAALFGTAIIVIAHTEGVIPDATSSSTPILDFSGKPIGLRKSPRPWMTKAVLWAMIATFVAGVTWKLTSVKNKRPEHTMVSKPLAAPPIPKPELAHPKSQPPEEQPKPIQKTETQQKLAGPPPNPIDKEKAREMRLEWEEKNREENAPIMVPPSPVQEQPVPLSPVSPVILTAEFVNPASPALSVYNPSAGVVEGVLWSMIAFRTSDLCFFGFQTQKIDFIKPQSKTLNMAMALATMPKNAEGCDGSIREGDELTGSVSIDCPHCSIQTYIIHLVWGESGWYFESDIKGGYIVPKDMSGEGRKKYVQLLTGEQFASKRIEIMPQAGLN